MVFSLLLVETSRERRPLVEFFSFTLSSCNVYLEACRIFLSFFLSSFDIIKSHLQDSTSALALSSHFLFSFAQKADYSLLYRPTRFSKDWPVSCVSKNNTYIYIGRYVRFGTFIKSVSFSC